MWDLIVSIPDHCLSFSFHVTLSIVFFRKVLFLVKMCCSTRNVKSKGFVPEIFFHIVLCQLNLCKLKNCLCRVYKRFLLVDFV